MEEKEEIILDPGFRFSPMDGELIEYYLKPKVLGQNLPCQIIQERELFGANANPWQLFDLNNDCWMVSEDESEKVMYVFTHVIKKASASTTVKKKRSDSDRDNFLRTAGCGTWSSKTGPKQVKHKGMVIGAKRYLVFQINKIGADFDFNKVGGQYAMHEYTLSGVDPNIVLCKITLDRSKSTVVKLLDHEKIDECTKPNKNLNKIDQSTNPKKNQKKVETGTFFTEGVYESEIAGHDQIVNSASDNNLSGGEGADYQGFPKEYVGAITNDSRDMIVYNESEGVYESVVENGNGSQVMEIDYCHEDDIDAIWNMLPTPSFEDMTANATGVAGYYDGNNETLCDSTLYGVAEDELYTSEVLNAMSEVPLTSYDPPIDPHEVDLYLDIEALLKDLSSKGEESTVFENSKSELLGKRKLVDEISHDAKRFCL